MKGGPGTRPEPFSGLIEYLKWIGPVCCTLGIGGIIAGAFTKLTWLLRLGGCVLAGGVGCFLAIGLVEFFGHWLIWGILAAASVLGLPAYLRAFIWLERKFNVDLWPGAGIGPGGEPLNPVDDVRPDSGSTTPEKVTQ